MNANLSFADLSGAKFTVETLDSQNNYCQDESLFSPRFTGVNWTQSNLTGAQLNGARR